MLAELGQICLILAFLTALCQGVLPLLGAHRMNSTLMAFGDRAAITQAVLLITAFLILTVLFLVSDFSVDLVAKHSHTSKPLLYKWSGVWGNHEGSMLLWILIVGLFGAAMALAGQSLPAPLRARALAIQGWIGFGFLAFLLFTSNPFSRRSPIPEDGSGLNPLLQDPGLAFHPPFLYLGYVGFSVAFSFAVAALIDGRVDALWARFVRPWVLAAWSFLTLGIALGSYWAYYELGWGGWWFWDPVENVSLMPWLAGTALLHSTLVVEKRNTLVNWTMLLAIATFSLSLIGTFVVRSGLLTSVHAFAVDPDRGLFILGLLVIATGGSLLLYALRSHKIVATTTFDATSKEGGLVLNNLLLCAATATVFLGTFYPMLIDAFSDDKITVGPPYFNMTFNPIMTVLIVFMAIGPLVKWRVDKPSRLLKPALIMLAAFAILSVLVSIFGTSVIGGITMGLALALAIGAFWSLAEKAQFGKAPFDASLKLLGRLPASTYGFTLAHVGLAITMAGVIGISVWGQEGQARLKIGEQFDVSGYTIQLDRITEGQRENFALQTAELTIFRGDRPIETLYPQRRFYPVEDMMTTEAGLDYSFTRNLYSALGEGNEDGWVIRFYVHPLVTWIWFGALIMAIGGFVSMADRRFRMPKASERPTGMTPQPAE